MKLTTNTTAEIPADKMNDHLRSLITSTNGSSNAVLAQNRKPLKTRFSGFVPELRPIILSSLNLPATTTDIELMDELDNLFDKADLVKHYEVESKGLKYQLAAIMVNEAISKGALKTEEKETYTRLATSDLETTKAVIYGSYQNGLELNDLMKLSGHELYMTDKLERLKELNEDCFKLKLKELEKHDYRNTDSANVKNSVISNQNNNRSLSELDELMKLNADQLYFEDGKMERLKVLNFEHFKLMYKEIFSLEYKA